ncbi:hypothetical protein J4H89_23530 (plasmid) [Ralstonia solanacearum]|nr:hypothetical protein J4H89_23530 [Ralstonia solanacearum]
MGTSISDAAWRRFQEELAAVDRKATGPLSQEELAQLTRAQRLVLAQTEFLDLKRKFGLHLDDVITFFPEEEAIAYLQTLLAK